MVSTGKQINETQKKKKSEMRGVIKCEKPIERREQGGKKRSEITSCKQSEALHGDGGGCCHGRGCILLLKMSLRGNQG